MRRVICGTKEMNCGRVNVRKLGRFGTPDSAQQILKGNTFQMTKMTDIL